MPCFRTMIASFDELARSLDSVEGRKDVVLLSEGFQSRLLVGTTETSQEQDFLIKGEIWKVDADRRFGNMPLRNELSDMTSLFRRSDCVIHSVDPETQQMLVDTYAHRSFHAQVKEKGAHVPLSELKLLKSDPAAVQEQSEAIKARYTKLFGV